MRDGPQQEVGSPLGTPPNAAVETAPPAAVWIRASHAARLLGCSVDTIRRRGALPEADARHLPRRPHGARSWRYSLEAVERAARSEGADRADPAALTSAMLRRLASAALDVAGAVEAPGVAASPLAQVLALLPALTPGERLHVARAALEDGGASERLQPEASGGR